MQIDEASAPLTPTDLALLARVDTVLTRGLALKRWWETKHPPAAVELDHERVERIVREGPHLESFHLALPSERWSESLSYGFFDEARIGTSRVPLFGSVQQMFFDQPKLSTALEALQELSPGDAARIDESRRSALELWRNGLRAFVLGHYFNSSFFESANVPWRDPDERPLEPYLRSFSWRIHRDQSKDFGVPYEQLYYKSSQTGRVGKFPLPDRETVNLHKLGEHGLYSWVVVRLPFLGTSQELMPAGATRPYLVLPFRHERLGILSPELLHCDDAPPAKGLRGQYGFTVVLFNADPEEDVARDGLRQIHFLLKDDGKILVQRVVVGIRGASIIPWKVDPLGLGFELLDRMSQGALGPLLTPLRRSLRALPGGRGFSPVLAFVHLANVVSGGMAQRVLHVSVEQLEKNFLTRSSFEAVRRLYAVVLAWRSVPDWTREEELPEWVRG